jgi:phage tail sheath protein FI
MPNRFNNPGIFVQQPGLTQKSIIGVSTATTVLIGTFPKGRPYTPTNFRSHPELDRTYGGLRNNNLSSLVSKQFFDNGGQDLWVISMGARLSRHSTAFLKGLSLLVKISTFNILVIPETSRLTAQEAVKVFQTTVPLVKQFQAVYLIDPPQIRRRSQTAKDLVAWIRAQRVIQDSNVMLYYPKVHVHTQTGVPLTISLPASGRVAGIFSRTDVTHGVWKAPAGNNARLLGIVGLEKPLTLRDINFLTSANINALKPMSSSAYVVWGARTLSSDPEWKYVPVRRMALYIESSVAKGTEWAVFEPNGEPLWAHLRQSVETFMKGLFTRGAFQGNRTSDAYFVKCGRDTTTAADQAAGTVHIIVGFAPLKPAEFVILKIKQNARPGV